MFVLDVRTYILHCHLVTDIAYALTVTPIIKGFYGIYLFLEP